MEIKLIEPQIDLKELEIAIGKSSNFEFVHQFFSTTISSLADPETLIDVLNHIADVPELHQFLLGQADYSSSSEEFRINRLDKFSYFKKDKAFFGEILAGAALDIIGAYSKTLRFATPEEAETATKPFERFGKFEGFMLSRHPSENYHENRSTAPAYYCSWFFDVVWDYLLIATWPEKKIFWIGCLTDSD